MNKLYDFVKEQIKSVPCSASLNVYDLLINEKHFFSSLKDKYELYLLFFDKNVSFYKVDENNCDGNCIESSEYVSYYLKLNNQIYMEYRTYNVNKDINVDDIENYNISDIFIYASNSHKEEFIKLLEYISEYIKKNKK